MDDIFDSILANKNKGRENEANEAPAERFRRSRLSMLCLWTSNGGPIKLRRSVSLPFPAVRAFKTCLERWPWSPDLTPNSLCTNLQMKPKPFTPHIHS
jgi:hypothetical protein